MEGLPNRRQRRLWAKQNGLHKKKKNMSKVERADLRHRSQEAGKQIHRANTERVLREQEDCDNVKKSEQALKLMEQGFTQEEALIKINESLDGNLDCNRE